MADAPLPLSEDPRWRRLHETGWRCKGCNEEHFGLMEFAYDHPHYWQDEGDPQPNSAILSADHILTEDFCIIKDGDEQYFFIRAILPLPIVGTEDEFWAYGVWASAFANSFNAYLEIFDSPHGGDSSPLLGRLSSQINGYPDTLNMKCTLVPQDNRQRPHIVLDEESNHPLVEEQINGISFDRILELHKINGYDISAALSDG